MVGGLTMEKSLWAD